MKKQKRTTEPPFLPLLAWRNIWRNKRRTLITLLSVFMAVLLSSLMISIQQGAWNAMIANLLNTYTGYIQIHRKGYNDNPSVNLSFQASQELIRKIESHPKVQIALPRLESFALASTENLSRGVLVLGINPDAENAITKLTARISKGKYFAEGEKSALLSDSLAAHLQLQPGDTIVLLSQGYHGMSAAGKYSIAGLVHFPSPDINRNLVLLPLKTAQEFYGTGNRITSLALFLDSDSDVQKTAKTLQNQVDTSQYEVLSWTQTMPELVQARDVDTAGAILMLAVLYVIVSFGIFGTLIMMVRERIYEMGVLIAIGMKRYLLGIMFWLEITFIGLLGAILGMAASFPVVYYFNQHPINMTQLSSDATAIYERFGFEPIFPASMDPIIFARQALFIFLITSIMALYPFWTLKKLKVTEAMKS